MSFITGSPKDTWQPVMTDNTTLSSYWLNWRFFLCATWNPPCLVASFQTFCFLCAVVLLAIAVMVDGGTIFYYYTQWTFTSVTIYFALGSLLSMRGCYQYHKRLGGDKVDNVEADARARCCLKPHEILDVRQPAGKWAFIFQIFFQMNAGAVMLTDFVFWFVLVPFLEIKDYHLNAYALTQCCFLLGDTALNSLRFPWFRIAYFFIWTVVYVLFQWIVHATFRLWWPYPFLDLSSPYAPLWYLSVAVMHIPCYGIFAFILKLKHTVFKRWYPDSYQ
ncbi:UDP-N-acetylglucosamine-N-acetylmuramyl-pyrophosphoryl-undecaprenol [Salix suchowensis]|nr:UDP-N-acetylglucosamine-N-acetylmuramyl-pyrophosphoryl-undecaprenol [Salix suchowensis]